RAPRGREVWCSVIVCPSLGRRPWKTARPGDGAAGSRRLPTAARLLAQAEPLDQPGVTLRALVFQVLEEPLAPGNELQQAAPRMVVLGVGLEVVGQVGYPVGQQGDLDLRGARVGFVDPILPDDVGLLGRVLGNAHWISFISFTLFYKQLDYPEGRLPFQGQVNSRQSIVN